LRAEKVTFDSDDAKINGKLFLSTPTRQPSPAVIICHGFDKRGFSGYNILQQLAQKACEKGFVSLVFDFRGCGESTGKFDYGWGEQRDLKAALNYVASRKEVKSDSIFVVGHSLGGAVALYVARDDKRIKGVALWATPHDHAYNVKKFISRSRGRMGYYLFWLISYFDAVVNLSRFFSMHVYGITLRPLDVRQKLMKLKESEVLQRLGDVSILIVNGSGDLIVGLEEAKINYEAAREPKKLVVIDSGDHAFLGKEEETIEETIIWLAKSCNVEFVSRS